MSLFNCKFYFLCLAMLIFIFSLASETHLTTIQLSIQDIERQAELNWESGKPILSILQHLESVKIHLSDKSSLGEDDREKLRKKLAKVGTPISLSFDQLVTSTSANVTVQTLRTGHFQFVFWKEPIVFGKMIAAHSGFFISLFNREATVMATTGGSKEPIKLWKVTASDQKEKVLPLPKSFGKEFTNFVSLAFSPDSKLLLSGTNHGKIVIYDLENTAKSPQVLDSENNKGLELIVLSDNDTVVVSHWTGETKSFRLSSKEKKFLEWQPWVNEIRKLTESPNKKWVLGIGSTIFNASSYIWNIQNPTETQIDLPNLNYRLSANGRWLLGYSFNTESKIWDLNDPKKDPLLIPNSLIKTDFKNGLFDILSDGSVVISQAGKISVWNPIQNQITNEFFTEGEIQTLHLVDEERKIIHSSIEKLPLDINGYYIGERTVFRQFDLTKPNDFILPIHSYSELVQTACQIAGRNPTKEEWFSTFTRFMTKDYAPICSDVFTSSDESKSFAFRTWVREYPGTPGIEIETINENKFSAIQLGEGVYNCTKGTYSSTKSSVTFKSDCCAGEGEQVGTFKCESSDQTILKQFTNLQCKELQDKDSFRYTRLLDCGSFKVWDSSTAKKPGSITNLGKMEVETLAPFETISKGKMDIRKFPNHSSPKVQGGLEDVRVKVYAKTRIKPKNSKQPEEIWYYVEADLHASSVYGWVLKNSLKE